MSELSCQLCLKETNVDFITRCGHKFHEDCIIQEEFIKYCETKCPVCKTELSKYKVIEAILFKAREEEIFNYYELETFFKEINDYEFDGERFYFYIIISFIIFFLIRVFLLKETQGVNTSNAIELFFKESSEILIQSKDNNLTTENNAQAEAEEGNSRKIIGAHYVRGNSEESDDSDENEEEEDEKQGDSDHSSKDEEEEEKINK